MTEINLSINFTLLYFQKYLSSHLLYRLSTTNAVMPLSISV